MEQSISFNFNARYCKLGDITPDSKAVWFVLHGYGQLATYFIKKFEVLVDQGHCVIAPEGLHRFYLMGFNGRVGASWMTREDRLRDIENYLKYLNGIYRAEIPAERGFKINVLGFSQGAATASRWVTQNEVSFDKLILWAGIFPPDLNMDLSSTRLQDKKIYLTYGLQDQYVTAEKLSEQNELVSRLGVNTEVLTFDGGHEIDNDTLLAIEGLKSINVLPQNK